LESGKCFVPPHRLAVANMVLMRGLIITPFFGAADKSLLTQQELRHYPMPCPVPKGQRALGFFFEPILNVLADFHWVSDESPVKYVTVGDDVEWLGNLIDWVQTKDSVYFQPGMLLPRFAADVEEDWNNLYGFRKQPDAQRFIEELEPLLVQDGQAYGSFVKGGGVFDRQGYDKFLEQHGSASGRYIAQHADLFFRNVDGAWWEMYARDESLIDSVRRHLKDVIGLRLIDQLLEGRYL
jgi:hypothetical protein